MRFIIDHDFHIHSGLSLCSGNPEQNPSSILEYGKKNELRHICLTDHFWDEAVSGIDTDWYRSFYRPQNYTHLAQSLPLPEDDAVGFHFGCETDMDKNFQLGITEETMNKFEFVIVSLNHFHMTDFTVGAEDSNAERIAMLYIYRMQALLRKKLPKNKIGLGHLTTLGDRGLTMMNIIPDSVLADLFYQIAEKQIGIELNMPIESFSTEEKEAYQHFYTLAKQCGCKFYLGSDAHHPSAFNIAMNRFNSIVDWLELTEDDKFRPFDVE